MADRKPLTPYKDPNPLKSAMTLPKKIDLKLFLPRYLVTISIVSNTDKIPEIKNPNNKYGDISSSKNHNLFKNTILYFNKTISILYIIFQNFRRYMYKKYFYLCLY